jgi:hypothetical protein
MADYLSLPAKLAWAVGLPQRRSTHLCGGGHVTPSSMNRLLGTATQSSPPISWPKALAASRSSTHLPTRTIRVLMIAKRHLGPGESSASGRADPPDRCE